MRKEVNYGFFWSDDYKVEWVHLSDQALHGIFMKGEYKMLVSFIYAKYNVSERRKLWQELENVRVIGLLWVVSGNFNIIRNDSKRVGGHPRPLQAMEDFKDCIDKCYLLELPVFGRKLSWCNGHEGLTRSWARLDRTLVSEDVLHDFLEANMKYLPAWKLGDSGMMLGGLEKLAAKLKATKNTLKVWNKQVFGKVDNIILELEERVEALDHRLQDTYSDDIEQEYLISKIELEECIVKTQKIKVESDEAYRRNYSLNTATNTFRSYLSYIIESAVSQEEGDMLFALRTEDEVRAATVSIPMDSTPGLDGYGSAFFI
ncbi:uncharacterized protein LOC111397916 [Olea europaea var. sylvestris]|uniref:uncharacterized protein LOC111397916 n=1 Tax=Olea europaea var. sylvestris TaxID=158386 RepID=UPI000C1D695B|nr:uncharacterized protein LOC111397916 [Olea europaea var. sylvestris]